MGDADDGPERYYLCQTYKSGRIDVLDGDGFDEFSSAYLAASEPYAPADGGHWILPGVCASRRVLKIGDNVLPRDVSVRLVVRTEGYHPWMFR